MQTTIPPEMPMRGWAPGGSGLLSRWLDRLLQTRPSPARGILLGLFLSLLIWAAILGFLLALWM